jgi:serine/threonine protein kinase/Tfp pilus assembly protein PilF
LRQTKDISIPQTETLRTPVSELATGTTFAGRYQVIEELGRGGMGRVYKVFDTDIKDRIALKLLKPEIAADDETIERFRNELKFARQISHRNVCRMYDLSRAEGIPYITMEYVSGENLKSMIRMTGQLSIGTAINIAKQICEGLDEAHRLGVVHRDLKPQNIMIDHEGKARIMDFGIARSIKIKGITETGVLIGTPEYMSPEQVEGKDIDGRSDLYSLGIILYEMITGRVPFEGDTPFSVGVKQKIEIPKDPKSLNKLIPDDLNILILRCLEKSQEKRYQSARDILGDLAKIEQSIPLADWALTQKARDKEKTDETKRKSSIAVLPFSDLSPQRDQEYFCDGFAEELINALAKVDQLQVASRTSAFHLKGKGYDIQEIGSKLKVQTVLEGSVRKAGNRLRITVQLVDIADGYHIWSEKFDRDLDDIFAIQDEVTLAIVDKLKVKLLGDEKEKILKRYTDNIEAYNLYLKGRYFLNRRNEEDLKRSVECFQQAIEKDPSYALAFSGMADAFICLPYYSSFAPKEAYPRAKEAALEALKRDDLLAEAHTSLAFGETHTWEFADAEQEFRRAIELNPGYSIAHHWYSNLLLYTGRFEEAFEEIKRALALDPLSLIINRDLGELFYYSRQYDKAIEQYRKTLEIDPNFIYVHLDLGLAYLQKSMYEEALKEIQRENSDAWLGIAYALIGNRVLAQQLLENLERRLKFEYISPYVLAILSFILEDNERGFKWLEKAYQERNAWLKYLKIEPLFDIIRNDPRFKTFLKKTGLD